MVHKRHEIQKEIPISFINIVSETFSKGEINFTANEIISFFSQYHLEYEIKFPHIKRSEGIMIKRQVIGENISAASPPHQYNIIKRLCEIKKFKKNESVQGLKIDLIKKYNHLDPCFEDERVDPSLIEEIKYWLKGYPEALSLYQAAMLKYNGRIFERNLLDDLRLSLEKFLQQLLGNHFPLEKQIESVGAFIKEKGSSKEIRNMFMKLLDYYGKYQNEYAKHNDLVKEQEIDFILEITNSFMKFLIKIKNR